MTQADFERKTMKTAAELAVLKLVEEHGSYAAAADAVSVSRQLFHYWKVNGKISGHRARLVAEMTGVPVEYLRPDLFGPPETKSWEGNEATHDTS